MRFLLIIGFSFLSHTLFCQSPNVDSLVEIISHNGGDAKTFYALKKLGELSEKEKPELAVSYYLHALQFPFRTIYGREFVHVYNSLADLYLLHGKYDSSLLLNYQALELARKTELDEEVGKAYQGIGLNYLRQTNYDSARFCFQQALDVFIKLKDASQEAGIYVNLGNVYLEERIYSESLNQFIKAATLFEGAARDSSGLARAWLNIANIENIMGQYEKALNYVQGSLSISMKKKNDGYIAYCHNLSGRIFRKQRKFESALKEYDDAIKIYRKRGDIRNEAEVIFAVGNILFDQKSFDQAITNYKTALVLSAKINATSQLAYTHSALGKAYFELKNYKLSLAYMDSSMTYAILANDPYIKIDAYMVKSLIYNEQKSFEKAFLFHEKYASLKDSVTQEENRQVTEELEAKYQNTKKQAAIELLQKDQQLQNVSLRQSRTVQTALVIAFVMMVAIGILVFTRNKAIQQARRQAEIERVRNQIARDLHDDMGSTLSSINLISQVALAENSDGQQTKYFKRIADQSSKMMESMSDMVWSINPHNDTLQKTVVKMKEFSAEILEPKNIGYKFEIDEALNPISLDVASRKNLFLIFKESINNAAKYSDSSFINIFITKESGELLLTIKDNGKGFDQSNPSSGNGLRNIKERANEIGANLRLDSVVGSGTSLIMGMPLT